MNHKQRERSSLTPQQKRAIRLLADGKRPSHVARVLGISRRTLWAWRYKDARFKKRLEDYMQELEDFAKSIEKQALAVAWRSAIRMMRSKKSRAAAVQLVLTILRGRADAVRVQHGGKVQHDHGDVTHTGEVQLKGLTRERKEAVKKLLELTRDDLIHTNGTP